MLRLIVVFLLVAVSKGLSAQAYKDSINAQFLRYTDFLKNKEFAKSTEYLNPELFKLIPKDQIIAMIEKTYNNPMVSFSLENPTILSIGESRLINGTHFSKLQYSNFLLMHYNVVEGKVSDTSATRLSLAKQFGQENVTYNNVTDTYKIFVVKDVIASSVDKKKWTFVVVEEKQKPMLLRFIPKELL